MTDRDWDFISEQIGKVRFSRRRNMWLGGSKNEDEFHDYDAVTYISPSNFSNDPHPEPSFKKMKKQVGKKKPTKRKKENRIAEKSLLLSTRVGK